MSMSRQVVLILACATVAAGLSAAFHPRRPPWFEVVDPARERWEIDVERARELLVQGPVVWIDARPRADFDKDHLPGALLLNSEEWGDLMFENQDALRSAFDQPVIVYCDGSGCERSADIAQRLRELLGLDPVYVLKGPWQDLRDAAPQS